MNRSDLTQSMLADFTGSSAGPGVAEMLPLLLGFAKDLIPDDSFLGRFMDSYALAKGTPFQNTQNRQQRKEMKAAQRLAETATAAARHRRQRDIAKAKVSKDQFLADAELVSQYGQGDVGYDRYLAGQVKIMEESLGWSMAARLGDIYGTNAEEDAATGFYGTLISNSRRLGNRNAMLTARKMQNRLFNDVATGQSLFDSKAYGGFDKTQIYGLGAAMSRISNELTSLSSDATPDQLTYAVNTFRSRLKKTAEALSSLRDVVGDDMGKALGIVEQVTGQQIGAMSPSKVKAVADMVSSNIIANGVSLDSLMGKSATIYGFNKSRINSGGMFEDNVIGSAMVLSRLERADLGGSRFGDYQVRQKNLADVARSSQSGQARVMKYAYAAWKTLADNQEKTVDDFVAESEAAGGGDAFLSRIMQQTGTVNAVDLRNWAINKADYKDITEAETAGVGTIIASKQDFRRTAAIASFNAAMRAGDIILSDGKAAGRAKVEAVKSKLDDVFNSSAFLNASPEAQRDMLEKEMKKRGFTEDEISMGLAYQQQMTDIGGFRAAQANQQETLTRERANKTKHMQNSLRQFSKLINADDSLYKDRSVLGLAVEAALDPNKFKENNDIQTARQTVLDAIGLIADGDTPDEKNEQVTRMLQVFNDVGGFGSATNGDSFAANVMTYFTSTQGSMDETFRKQLNMLAKGKDENGKNLDKDAKEKLFLDAQARALFGGDYIDRLYDGVDAQSKDFIRQGVHNILGDGKLDKKGKLDAISQLSKFKYAVGNISEGASEILGKLTPEQRQAMSNVKSAEDLDKFLRNNVGMSDDDRRRMVTDYEIAGKSDKELNIDVNTKLSDILSWLKDGQIRITNVNTVDGKPKESGADKPAAAAKEN